MHVVLLSGGSGKRLWPLSNDVRAKQFLKIFRKRDGNHESMFQRMCRMLREVDNDVSLTVAAAEKQVALIKLQLNDSVDISVEPCRKDTFPAIALASAYLRDVKKVEEDEPIVVCPVDPYVDAAYFQKLKVLASQAEKEENNLVLMGIEPTSPSSKYGYIIPKDKNAVSEVSFFKEKPDTEAAERYIQQGALWNSGVFAFKLGYLLKIAKTLLETSKYRIYSVEKFSSISSCIIE